MSERDILDLDDRRAQQLAMPIAGILALTRAEERRRVIAWLRSKLDAVPSMQTLIEGIEDCEHWTTGSCETADRKPL